eukprot:TRINITY_DN12660_c0_g1_i2.p1 TRINITY_DN12660_c0_g1~~TRINITY_DN12660_c0_g1_i2.p1  ORF type:complete len:1294 (-),score=207.67 TRINITY_DN12660_c0_g1_i2:56-3883(-)
MAAAPPVPIPDLAWRGGWSSERDAGDSTGCGGSTPRLHTMPQGQAAASSSAATTASSSWQDREARNKARLAEAMKEVELLTERANIADEERRRCLEVTRSLKGPIRIMGRVRPPLQGEEQDGGCLRVISKQQLEVLTEPRALLTEQLLRHRRRTTGGIRDAAGSKSLSVLSEATENQAPLDCRTFYFDDLFDSEAGDDDIFTAVRDELDAAVDGEAVCILAYGATGSGKTHTMTNLAERAASELERQATALSQGGVKMEITVQIVEIYNDQLRDLLAVECGGMAEPPRLKLSVSSSGTTLMGAVSRTISTEQGGNIACRLADALRIGQAQRATSNTVLNGRSSRSHMVMTLFLTIRDATSGLVRRSGKLSLVDLAGSERLKRSEAVGERRREAQHINRSLSALADVISAKERRVAHVPYRNSKLTQLLQDALGGAHQCRTVVIVALPPTRESLSDTLHSLQFSSRLTALSLPKVPSRRSLRSPGAEQRGNSLRRFPSVPADGEMRDHLLQEVSHWRAEYQKAQAQMDAYRTALEVKDRELREEKRRNAELVATTQVASENFERSRAQIFSGFAALNQRIQDVVETSLDGSHRGLPDAAGHASASQRQMSLDAFVDTATQEDGRGGRRGRHSSLRHEEAAVQAPPPTPRDGRESHERQARASRSGARGASASTSQRTPAGLRVSKSADSDPVPYPARSDFSRIQRAATEDPAVGPLTARGSSPGRFAGGRRGFGGSSPRSSAVSGLAESCCGGGSLPSGEPWASGTPSRLAPKSASPSVEVPTPARAHLTGSGQRAAEASPALRSPHAGNASPATPASSPPAWMEQPKESRRPSWALPLRVPGAATSSGSLQEEEEVKAGPVAFELSPPTKQQYSEAESAQVAGCFSSELFAAWPSSPASARQRRNTSPDPSTGQRHSSPVGSPPRPAGVPIFALSPRAAPHVQGVERRSESPPAAGHVHSVAQASRGHAERSAHSPSPVRTMAAGLRPRSTSSHRRANTPREYVVEVISEARARELTFGSDCQVEESPRSSRQCPPSPALLLCPGQDEDELDEGDDMIGNGVFLGLSTGSDHDGSISPSSDEGEIRDRLKQSLQLRGLQSPDSVEALASLQQEAVAAAAKPQPSTSRGTASRGAKKGPRMGSPGSLTARSPTGTRSKPPARGAAAAPRSARAASCSSSPPPRQQVRGRGASPAAEVPPPAPPEAPAASAVGSGCSLAAAASAAASYSRGGVGRLGKSSNGSFSARGPAPAAQRCYTPVLSRRSLLTGTDWPSQRR